MVREVDVHGENAHILRPMMEAVSIGGHMVGVGYVRHVAWLRVSLVLRSLVTLALQAWSHTACCLLALAHCLRHSHYLLG